MKIKDSEEKKEGLSRRAQILEGCSHVNWQIRGSTRDEVIEDDCVIRTR